MIEIQHANKRFGSKEAVKDLDLQINDGEVFGLLGPNGAGKSTTIKMMTGILKPTSGDILLDGHSIEKDGVAAKMTFGFVPDTPDIFLGMKASEYLAFMASCYHAGNDAMQKAYQMAERFHLDGKLNSLIVDFSHGMRQKIIIIGTLLHDPQNWILDEPLTGLDPEAAFDVKQVMRERAENGKTVLFSTHVLDVAEKVCDRVGIISEGTLRFVGTLDELREKENRNDGDLEDLFLSLVKE